jgi:hypothetical protein
MSEKTYNYVETLIMAVTTIAVASVSYFFEPGTAATANAVITIVSGAAIKICKSFVKA